MLHLGDFLLLLRQRHEDILFMNKEALEMHGMYINIYIYIYLKKIPKATLLYS